MRRLRGNTMAFYAAFLAICGLPLLAVTVDVSRAYLLSVRLRSATEAGCEAYANSLDIEAFKDAEGLRFKNAYTNAYNAFNTTMGSSAGFSAFESRSNSDPQEVVIVCGGGATLTPLVPLIGHYDITASATAKTKFSTSRIK